MQLVRVLVDPRFGWSVESTEMMRWFDLVAICTDQVVHLPPGPAVARYHTIPTAVAVMSATHRLT